MSEWQDLTNALKALGFSTRTANCLRNENCRTLDDIAAHTEAEIMLFPNFGLVCLREVKAVLHAANMSLANEWSGLPPLPVGQTRLTNTLDPANG